MNDVYITFSEKDFDVTYGSDCKQQTHEVAVEAVEGARMVGTCEEARRLCVKAS